MGATKETFVRHRMIEDNRITEDYPPFDHQAKFRKKVKENWLTNKDFEKLLSANLKELTLTLIEKKMDDEYMTELMKLIDKKEPKYIKDLEYIKLIERSPIENLKRIFKKYDNINYFIKGNLKKHIELMILNK